MAVAFVPLAQAIWGAIVSTLVSMAENMGGQAAFERFTRALAHRGIAQQVTEAVQNAFERFATELHDPELVALLGRDTCFQTDHTVIQVLAEAAVKPLERDHQIQTLAARIHASVPQIAQQRCRQAAEVLIGAVHDAAASIKQLQFGILVMQGREILDLVAQGKEQPYVPGLRATIVAQADALQRELGHNYVVSAHLLYALMMLPSGVARSVLERRPVTPERMKMAIKLRVKPYTGPVQDGMSTGAATALDEAQQVAHRRGAAQTRDDHLMEVLATRVTRGGEGSTTLTAVFNALGLSASDVLADVIRAGQVESQIQSSLNVLTGEIPLS